ncbi:MAG: hypothetical protein KatS3mg102_2271 [Planctomycetota bacterium]|nr:MAG: hypothetical protein KatS3mg102_2271 [Planctomycetota bacterium]
MARMDGTTLRVRPQGDGIVVLELHGYIDHETVHRLDQTIVRLVDAGSSAIVVDCSRLTYISSDGMGVFLSHLIRIRRAAGDIKFCAMNREARTVIEAIGLSNLLQVYPTEAEALEAFRAERRQRAAAGGEDEQEQKLRIALEPQPDERVAVLRLSGYIDRQTVDSLEQGLTRALEQGRPCLVIDCEGLSYVSSSGMGVFLAYLQKARARGGDLRFCRMREATRTVMSMLGLQNIFQIFETEDEALGSYAALD